MCKNIGEKRISEARQAGASCGGARADTPLSGSGGRQWPVGELGGGGAWGFAHRRRPLTLLTRRTKPETDEEPRESGGGEGEARVTRPLTAMTRREEEARRGGGGGGWSLQLPLLPSTAAVTVIDGARVEKWRAVPLAGAQ